MPDLARVLAHRLAAYAEMRTGHASVGQDTGNFGFLYSRAAGHYNRDAKVESPTRQDTLRYEQRWTIPLTLPMEGKNMSLLKTLKPFRSCAGHDDSGIANLRKRGHSNDRSCRDQSDGHAARVQVRNGAWVSVVTKTGS
jgi:hypothetical protein